ncbi:MAG: hypothetical protein IAG13_28015 [Deltaproteobacteria bacterium]|nr:hypothetical protein [Nannocystaceae bacterium]
MFERAKLSLDATKAALAKAEVPSTLKCAEAQSYGQSLAETQSANADVVALLADLETTCDHELPKATVNAAIAKAVKARAAQPDAPVLDECFSGPFDLSLEDLKDAKDPEASALELKFREVCPAR